MPDPTESPSLPTSAVGSAATNPPTLGTGTTPRPAPSPCDPPTKPRRFPDLDSLLRRPAPQPNPHPWPLTSRSKRTRAIRVAAEDCFARGLSRYQTSVLVRDWDSRNPRPMTNMEAGYPIALVYESHKDDELRTERSQTHELLHLSQHCLESIPPREWIIPGVLPANQRTALLGRWASGKSWLALDMALSVVFGTPFLGDVLPTARGNVVILDGEGGRTRAIRRFNQLRHGHQLSIANGDSCRQRGDGEIFWCSPEGFSLSSEGIADDLSELLAPMNPVLIIFDTLAKVMGLSDENSNAAASRVTKALYTLNQGLGAALLLLAHPAKGESSDATIRGAGELSADLDVLLRITKSAAGIRTVTCEKDRDADLENATFDFKIESTPKGTSLLRSQSVHPRNKVDEAILNALAGVSDQPDLPTSNAAPTSSNAAADSGAGSRCHGLSRTELAMIVNSKCGYSKSKTNAHIVRLKAAGRIHEIKHRLSLSVPASAVTDLGSSRVRSDEHNQEKESA